MLNNRICCATLVRTNTEANSALFICLFIFFIYCEAYRRPTNLPVCVADRCTWNMDEIRKVPKLVHRPGLKATELISSPVNLLGS